jgi:proteasome lid subunit RPN8/RPN11
MMWLSREQAQAIVDHARAESPREACGIIAGRGERAFEIISIPNTAADPQHAYRMDERRLAETLAGLDGRGLELVGLYHSHPAGEPIPSPVDVRQATYPDTPYLIVGLKAARQNWRRGRCAMGR